MCSAVYLTLGFMLLVSIKTAIAASDSWTLWMKTEMSTLDGEGGKTPVDTYWNPAGKTKESSIFGTKAQCESARSATITKFRTIEGMRDVAEGKRTTIKVQGETIILVAQYKDGKRDSEQKIELLCRNEDPQKGARVWRH